MTHAAGDTAIDLLRFPQCERPPLLLGCYVFTQTFLATVSIDADLVQLSIVCHAKRVVVAMSARDIYGI